jgi:mRNA interferase HicA
MLAEELPSELGLCWHSWWHNPALNKRSAIPRHSEISNDLAKKICRDLGVTPIR